MTITPQQIREVLSIAREFGVIRLKVDTLEIDFGSPVPPSPAPQPFEALPEELPLQMPSSEELLFGHTGMLPEAMSND